MDNVFQSEVDSAINVLKNELSEYYSGNPKKGLATALAVLEGATIVDDPEPDFTDPDAWIEEMTLAVRTGVRRHRTRQAKSLAELKALRLAWLRSSRGEVEEMLAYRFTLDANSYVR